jgi:hypothetical protein
MRNGGGTGGCGCRSRIQLRALQDLDIMDPYGVITWVAPEAAKGPS